MQIIKLNKENITDEHICCAFSDKKCRKGYEDKKEWLSKRFDESYVFKKLDVKHKVFIEYSPVEVSWNPVIAEGYTMINCFWVAGQYKKQGYGRELLEECLRDTVDTNGVAVISSKKKLGFLADRKFFEKFGFVECDSAEPYFKLLVKKNNLNAKDPKFTDESKQAICSNKNGFTVYYSVKCPFTDYYVNTEFKNIATHYNKNLKIIKLDTLEKIRKSPYVFTNYSIF